MSVIQRAFLCSGMFCMLSLLNTLVVADAPGYRSQILPSINNFQGNADKNIITLVADNQLSGLLAELTALFTQYHPDVKFRLLLAADASAMNGLTAGVSAFALMTRSAWPMEKRPFRQVHGYDASGFCVARVGYRRAGQISPPGIYVNAENPLHGLSMQDAGRILTAGMLPADISHWRQLGLNGSWSKRQIHIYGLRDDGTTATALRHEFWNALPFSHRYEPMADAASAISAVAEDPYGLALLGPYPVDKLPPTVRFLPLASDQGQVFADAGLDSVMSGSYPLSPCLKVYIDGAPESVTFEFNRAFLRMLLSRIGQEVIGRYSVHKLALVPLDELTLRRELTRLQ